MGPDLLHGSHRVPHPSGWSSASDVRRCLPSNARLDLHGTHRCRIREPTMGRCGRGYGSRRCSR